MDKRLKQLKEAWSRFNLFESLITTNSRNQPISDNEESIKKFWKWFGRSKMVNSFYPEVWYHVTTNEFSRFDIDKGSGVAGSGIYLTDTLFKDDRYGDKVLELYVRCENPLDLSGGDDLINDQAKTMGLVGLYDLRTIPQMREWSRDFRNKMIESGYDGCFVSSGDESRHLVVYNSDSVKSVNNKGSWSGDDIFESLNEIFEPVYPKGVKTGTVTKAGVQGSVIKKKQYQFNTNKGNNVKVHFKPGFEDDEADVVFYVNDTLYDDSSSLGGGVRDPEILPGVLGIVRKVADRIKLNTITFEAFSGEGDEKWVKDLPIKEIRQELLKKLKELEAVIEKHKVVEVEPSEISKKLAAKLGREPNKVYDLDRDGLLKVFYEMLEAIEADDFYKVVISHDRFEELARREKNNKKYPELLKLLELYKNYKDALYSRVDEKGLKVVRNRRAAVYEKLIARFFKGWDLEKTYNYYELTRKETL